MWTCSLGLHVVCDLSATPYECLPATALAYLKTPLTIVVPWWVYLPLTVVVLLFKLWSIGVILETPYLLRGYKWIVKHEADQHPLVQRAVLYPYGVGHART